MACIFGVILSCHTGVENEPKDFVDDWSERMNWLFL